MAVLIDTSVLVDAERGGSALAQVDDEEHLISVISVSELLHGLHRAIDDAVRVRREAFVEQALGGMAPVPITINVARVHAMIWANLEAAGEKIGTHDLWIAATALAYGLAVVTRNARDFERVPGLSVLTV